MSRGTSRGPREISWSLGMYNPIHPSSRQCTDTMHTKAWWQTPSKALWHWRHWPVTPQLRKLHTHICMHRTHTHPQHRRDADKPRDAIAYKEYQWILSLSSFSISTSTNKHNFEYRSPYLGGATPKPARRIKRYPAHFIVEENLFEDLFRIIVHLLLVHLHKKLISR